MSRRSAFTLVELMIVLMITGIIAAFAIPNLMESRKAAHEASAEKSMKTLIDAQANFMKADYDNDGKDFTDSLALLYSQTDAAGNKIALIAESLANGQKEGFDYSMMATYNSAGQSDPKYGFAFCAVPSQYGDTGRRTYIARHTGEVWYKDQGASTVVTDWSFADDAALTGAGWIRLGE